MAFKPNLIPLLLISCFLLLSLTSSSFAYKTDIPQQCQNRCQQLECDYQQQCMAGCEHIRRQIAYGGIQEEQYDGESYLYNIIQSPYKRCKIVCKKNFPHGIEQSMCIAACKVILPSKTQSGGDCLQKQIDATSDDLYNLNDSAYEKCKQACKKNFPSGIKQSLCIGACKVIPHATTQSEVDQEEQIGGESADDLYNLNNSAYEKCKQACKKNFPPGIKQSLCIGACKAIPAATTQSEGDQEEKIGGESADHLYNLNDSAYEKCKQACKKNFPPGIKQSLCIGACKAIPAATTQSERDQEEQIVGGSVYLYNLNVSAYEICKQACKTKFPPGIKQSLCIEACKALPSAATTQLEGEEDQVV